MKNLDKYEFVHLIAGLLIPYKRLEQHEIISRPYNGRVHATMLRPSSSVVCL